ncbi:MAG: response regulator transcription factor [Bacteroidetes bacterium]|nr:response regulator transcription factor [Bacteroidota bacterium]
MIKAIIVDDETRGRLALRNKIMEHCPTIEVVGEAADGVEAITMINRLNPTLVFLDIEMPQMNGFEMLEKLQEKDFYLIFTTAYNQYAIKAIRYAAFDYLLKPVDIEELKTAVEKVEKNIHQKLKARLDLLKENLLLPEKKIKRLAVSTQEGVLFIDINNITHLEASSNYTLIYLGDKTKITASKTLKDFGELLPSDIFHRVHNSYIVNLNYIKKYIRGDGGLIELTDGSLIEVSRKYKDDFLRWAGL